MFDQMAEQLSGRSPVRRAPKAWPGRGGAGSSGDRVLGGFVAAMLYDTVGPALLATLPPGRFIKTLDLNTTFGPPEPPAG